MRKHCGNFFLSGQLDFRVKRKSKISFTQSQRFLFLLLTKNAFAAVSNEDGLLMANSVKQISFQYAPVKGSVCCKSTVREVDHDFFKRRDPVYS